MPVVNDIIQSLRVKTLFPYDGLNRVSRVTYSGGGGGASIRGREFQTKCAGNSCGGAGGGSDPRPDDRSTVEK
jgi:hypothetical protein